MTGRRVAEFPRFRQRSPWWGPDLQTLRNFLRGPSHSGLFAASATRMELPLRDGSGDRLSALLQRPLSEWTKEGSGQAGTRPLAVLIHGLGGTEESAYMQNSAASLLARGHCVLRLNLRGAGPSRPLCSLQYHAGRTDDLRDALTALSSDTLTALSSDTLTALPSEKLTALSSEDVSASSGDGFLLVGYSLGGNMLLKFLAEHASAFDIRAAVSVSAPIDLAASSQRFLHPRNRVYHWHLLRSMRREALAAPVALAPEEERAIRAAPSILAFDDTFVAPRNGYRDAEEYYAENAARYYLDRIRVPTLVIHSLDDPWIPASAYTDYSWSRNPKLIPLLSRRGGHVGFHAAGTRTPWYDACIARHLESVDGV